MKRDECYIGQSVWVDGEDDFGEIVALPIDSCDVRIVSDGVIVAAAYAQVRPSAQHMDNPQAASVDYNRHDCNGKFVP